MKRKILISVVVLAAGLSTLLAYDSRAGQMLRNTMTDLDFHAPKLISSTFSSLSAEQYGIIIMVVIVVAVTIFLRGGDKDKMVGR
jgi:hypothetical protein